MKKKYIKPNIEVYNANKELLLTTSYEAGYSIDRNPPIGIIEQGEGEGEDEDEDGEFEID